MLSCPMKWALLQSSIYSLLPKVRIFLKNKISRFLCIVGLFCIYITGFNKMLERKKKLLRKCIPMFETVLSHPIRQEHAASRSK
jgi:hypothetical protein